jgi:prepilin-type N-terminal cleavage/methylation domain-containing protein
MKVRLFLRNSRIGGFTLLELIIVLVILVIVLYAVHHFFFKDKAASSTYSSSPKSNSPPDDSPIVNILKVILIGLICVCGIAWQAFLIMKKDVYDGPRRVIPAAAVAVVFVVGMAVSSLLAFLDDRRDIPFWTILENTGRGTLLGLALIVKSYLAPITAAFTLSCVVYFLLTYGEFRSIPLIQALFEWVFINAPKWISIGYVAGVGIYSLGSAIYDSDISL